MSRVLPILFNGDMVRATLDGRKTVTRRVVKYRYSNTEMKMRTDKYGTRLIEIEKDVEGVTWGRKDDGTSWHKLRGYIEPKAPCQPGDILYVRETWSGRYLPHGEWIYRYKATDPNDNRVPTGPEYDDGVDVRPWTPSIHMPKAAARIWLKVTDVRVERLQDITPADVVKEGAYEDCWECLESYSDSGNQCCYKQDDECSQCDGVITEWERLWNYTIKKPDQSRYGWNANPWVWVIEFERCGKPQEENG